MSYPSTLGFAPQVITTSEWMSKSGKEKFLEMVSHRTESLITNLPTLSFTCEMDTVLKRATASTDTFGQTLDKPSPSVLQAVEYMALTIVERIRMAKHLQDLRDRKCIAVQPRGCDDVQRHEDLFGPATVGVPGQYQRYLDQQQKMRLRYA